MNLQCYIISFSSSLGSPEYLYFCSDREIEAGDWYINPDNQDFTKLQECGYKSQVKNKNSVKVEASNNPNVGKPISQSFINQYYSLPITERPKKTHFRTT